MFTSTYRNAQMAFLDKLDEVNNAQELMVHGSMTKELIGQHITISNPRERCYSLRHRKDNIFAKIAETIWVLQGRDDIDYLSAYLPRAADFSDDGTTWRASYGRRLRHYGCFWEPNDAIVEPGTDQIMKMYDTLKADPYSRRAVAVLWDPSSDYDNYIDIPCNNWIQFLIRNKTLNMFVAQRSSDIIWGFSGINTFEWSVLHELLASWLDVEVGSLFYSITSLHLYQRHYIKAYDIVNSNQRNDTTLYARYFTPSQFTNINTAPPISSYPEQFEDIMRLVRGLEYSSRISDDGMPYTIPELENIFLAIDDRFFNACCAMLLIHNCYQKTMTKSQEINPIIFELLNLIPECDFKILAIEYISRTHPHITNSIMSDFTKSLVGELNPGKGL